MSDHPSDNTPRPEPDPTPAPILEMRLRPDRPPVTRLSRKVLSGLGGIAAVGIAGALFFALKPHQQPNRSNLYNTSNRHRKVSPLFPKTIPGCRARLPS